MKPQGWLIEHKLLACAAIVRHHVARAVHADEKLVQRTVRVLPTNLLIRYVVHKKITLHLKGNVALGLTESQAAAQVFHTRQAMDGDSLHLRLGAARFRWRRTRGLHPIFGESH